MPDPPPWPRLGDPSEGAGAIRAEVHTHLRGLLAETGWTPETLTDAMELGHDLGFDSLDRLSLNVWVAQRFGRVSRDIDRLITVGDLVYLAENGELAPVAR